MFFYKELMIDANIDIRSAMEVLDRLGSQFLIVIDNNSKLFGSLTDGDIRRGLLNGVTLDQPVEKIAHQNPITAFDGLSKREIKSLGLQHAVKQVIVVNSAHEVVGVEFVNQSIEGEKPNVVVLMAGGLGTRLHPLTEHKPKPLLHVGQKPILETIIESFEKYGFKKIYLSVNYKADMIKDYFKDGKHLGVEIEYLQENQRLGTAGALSLLDKKKVKDPFFVMNGDLLTNVDFQKMLDFHLEQKALATVGVREYDFQVPYGVVKTHNGYVTSIEEKPVHNFFVSAGIYLLEPELLDYVPVGEFYDMPTLLSVLINKEKPVSSFPVHEYWLDIGQYSDYQKANSEYLRHFQNDR